MDLNFTPAELAFRDEVRQFLRDQLPEDNRATGQERFSTACRGLHALAKDSLQAWLGRSRVAQAIRRSQAVQLHGGMGMTDELMISHYFKRLTAIDLTFGDTDFHTQQFIGISK